MSKQTQIDTEVDGNKLLATLLRYQIPEGVTWTADSLCVHLGWPIRRVSMAGLWLQRKGYISIRGGLYLSSSEGENYYDESKSKPTVGGNIQAFKDEVLTGVKQTTTKRDGPDWQRSEITRGALPKGGSRGYHDPEEDAINFDMAARAEKEGARSVGVSVEEFRVLMAEGRIALCKGWDGVGHVGRFHKKGERLHHLCAACRKMV